MARSQEPEGAPRGQVSGVVFGPPPHSLQPLTLGRDYGNTIEVIAGLTGHEQVIVNPPDSIESGQQVQIAGAAQP